MSARVNVLALQRILGHTSAKGTLDTYADLYDDDLDAVAFTLHARCSHNNVGKLWAKAGPDEERPDHKNSQLRKYAGSCGGGGGI